MVVLQEKLSHYTLSRKRVKTSKIELREYQFWLACKRIAIENLESIERQYIPKGKMSDSIEMFYDIKNSVFEDKILLQKELLKLRSKILIIRKLVECFTFDRLAFIVKNRFWNMSDFTICGIWNVEVKYRKLFKNRNRNKQAFYKFNSYKRNLQRW